MEAPESVPMQPTARVDTTNQQCTVIEAAVWDTTALRTALDSHRQKLGLGPSKNLINNIFSRVPEADDAQDTDACSSQQQQDHMEDYAFLPRDLIDPTTRDRYHKPSVPQAYIDGEASLPAPTYRGNHYLARNRSAGIPDEENCRLWITGLPPQCSVSELLGSIRGVGRVFATHVNTASANRRTTRRGLRTSSASLTFFTASAANQFLLRHYSSPFTVRGYRTNVVRHRIRTRSYSSQEPSRVLIIKGDPEIVTPECLARIFSEQWKIRVDTDFMEYRIEDDSNEIVWGFGSFRAQAYSVYTGITGTRRLSGTVTVSYGLDPCA